MRKTPFATLLVAVAAMSALAVPQRKPTPVTVSYAKTVKPILDRNCIGCHSGSTPAHHLDLTSYAKVMKGDHEGKVVVPKKVATSRLAIFIHRKDNRKMPPSQSLSAAEQKAIDAWINAGAKP